MFDDRAHTLALPAWRAALAALGGIGGGLLQSALGDAAADPDHIYEVWVAAGTYTPAASGSGDVVWGLQGLAVGDDDAIDAAFGTAQTVTDTLTAADDEHLTAETSAITIAGAPAEGDLVIFQAYRDADAAGDTLGSDASLIGIRLFITLDAADDS